MTLNVIDCEIHPQPGVRGEASLRLPGYLQLPLGQPGPAFSGYHTVPT